MKKGTDKKKDYSKVYRSYRRPIMCYLYSRVRQKDVAVDLASQVFVKLWENWDKIKIKTVRAWLYTVARNTLIDYYRRYKYNLEINDEYSEDGNSDVVEMNAQNKIQAQKVYKEIKNLKPKAKEIVLLRARDSMTFKEIATIMNLKEGSVKMLYYRSIKKLRRIIELKVTKDTSKTYNKLST